MGLCLQQVPTLRLLNEFPGKRPQVTFFCAEESFAMRHACLRLQRTRNLLEERRTYWKCIVRTNGYRVRDSMPVTALLNNHICHYCAPEEHAVWIDEGQCVRGSGFP